MEEGLESVSVMELSLMEHLQAFCSAVLQKGLFFWKEESVSLKELSLKEY